MGQLRWAYGTAGQMEVTLNKWGRSSAPLPPSWPLTWNCCHPNWLTWTTFCFVRTGAKWKYEVPARWHCHAFPRVRLINMHIPQTTKHLGLNVRPFSAKQNIVVNSSSSAQRFRAPTTCLGKQLVTAYFLADKPSRRNRLLSVFLFIMGVLG